MAELSKAQRRALHSLVNYAREQAYANVDEHAISVVEEERMKLEVDNKIRKLTTLIIEG